MRVHATALVVGTTGILITGPSGAGKTTLALRLIATAGLQGVHAALVADDQTELVRHGRYLVAAAPASIAGLVELRGAGPVGLATASRVVLHCALAPAALRGPDRVAPENERWRPDGPEIRGSDEASADLPLHRIAYESVGDPFFALRLLRGPL